MDKIKARGQSDVFIIPPNKYEITIHVNQDRRSHFSYSETFDDESVASTTYETMKKLMQQKTWLKDIKMRKEHTTIILTGSVEFGTIADIMVSEFIMFSSVGKMKFADLLASISLNIDANIME